MGFCGSCLRLSGYFTVVLISILAYFHLECVKEKEGLEKVTRTEPFKPGQTEVADLEFGFCTNGDFEMHIGLEYILIQSAPCALFKFINFLKGGINEYGSKYGAQNVTIHDARKTTPGSFHKTGFTLIELDEEPAITDWRSSPVWNEEAEITKFYALMEPHIMALYPETKRMQWTYNVVRGGDKFGDQPRAVGGPHLDYHQNDTARILFHEEYPALQDTEPTFLMGEKDNENEKLGVLLGVWKPIHPKAVCDYPLAVMDASTFDPKNQQQMKVHMNFGIFTFHNLGGGISYAPEQKWFYYSFQTTKEVLIFHQYSKNTFHANPHGSFLNKNCPEGSESRISVELRLALFF